MDRMKSLTQIPPGTQILFGDAVRDRRAVEHTLLAVFEGWSYQEIAAALGCRTGTIKSRINRARERLRESLAEYWNQPEARGER